MTLLDVEVNLVKEKVRWRERHYRLLICLKRSQVSVHDICIGSKMVPRNTGETAERTEARAVAASLSSWKP